MRENRIKKIFEILTEKYDTYTAKEISYLLSCSTKTIRDNIKELNNILFNNGAYIESKSGVGYKFVINDYDIFSKFIKEDWPKYALDNSPNSQEYRINYMALRLIITDDFIKSEEFLDVLFISRSLLNNDIKKMKEQLLEYELKIISKPYYGIKIVGNEEFKRNFIVDFIEEYLETSEAKTKKITKFNNGIISSIESIVLDNFSKFEFNTNFIKYNNFINYLIITAYRIKNGHTISSKNNYLNKTSLYKNILSLAESICKEVSVLVDIDFNNNEIDYIYNNLISKTDTYKSNDFNEKVYELIEKSLSTIYAIFSIDLRDDSELTSSLTMHIIPMIKRVNFGIKLKNPLLNDIKKDHIAFECAKICSHFISELYNIEIDDDELGYISLHFSASLARKKDKVNKKNILLVCASGRATAQVLKYRFKHEFSKYINKLDTSDYLKAMNIDLSNYDLIVTTIPLDHLQTNKPIIEVSAYLYKKDIKKISNLLKGDKSINKIRTLFNSNCYIKISDSQSLKYVDVLKLISSRLSDSKDINPDKYYEQLIEREKLACTSLENKVAIPHPLVPVSDQNFIFVLISNNDIQWNVNSIKLVILINLNDNIDNDIAESFYRTLSDFLIDDTRISKAIQTDNINDFLKIFINK